MDCCAADIADTLCPSCTVRGRSVGTVTLRSLVPHQTFEDEGWKFCRTESCPIAYYRGTDTVQVDQVSVAITHKSTSSDRPVCYCFGYSAHDIEQDGLAAIPAEIKARCRRGEDHCPETNPQGSCCLGNVLAIAKAGQAKSSV